MWEQEKQHVEKFEELLPQYRVRPTALLPIWSVAGYVLGAVHFTFFVDFVHTSHEQNLINQMEIFRIYLISTKF